MKAIVLIILSLFLFQCKTDSSSKIDSSKQQKSEIKTEIKDKSSMEVQPDSGLGTQTNLFVFKNENVKQTLEIIEQKEKTIKYRYIINSKKSDASVKFEGIANLKKGDAETDEDENGTAYLVDEYIDESDCWIAIRIDSDTHTKLRVIVADCENKEDYDLPLSSIGTLSK